MLQPVFQSEQPAQHAYARGKGQWAFVPYYALALAKIGSGDDAIALDQRLRAEDVGSTEQKQSGHGSYAVPDFDHHLLLAIGYALKGSHSEAQAEARKARATIDSQSIIDSGYVFVEILERLSEETKRPAYVDLALDYARAYQRLEPWTSWVYAFEARHATAGAARIRAAGIALILDPQSQWLQEVDKQTLAQGRQWATANRWPAKDVPRA